MGDPPPEVLLVVATGNTVRVWDIATAEERASIAHKKDVLSVRVADSKQYLTGYADGLARLWDAEGHEGIDRTREPSFSDSLRVPRWGSSG